MTTQPFTPITAPAPTPAGAPSAPTLEDLLGAARPPVRVSLLPREVVQARALRRTRRWLAAGLGGVAAALGAVTWLSATSVHAAEDELAAAQQRTGVLTAEQAQFAEVPAVLAQLEAARTARAGAMGADVLWYEYLDGLTRSLPADVWLTDVTVTVDAAAGAAAAASAAASAAAAAPAAAGTAPSGAAAAQVASATFSGVAFEHPRVADWLDSLDATPGFTGATYSTSSRTEKEEEVVVEFESSVAVTTDALSHRFDGATDGEVG
ncbi:PilN domain-containing protein [Quadrisphaera sp. DSM 44207]|uniref:PilN domain-containing protein n=1 Tax=Quadrisphaera sp. DSM 44207 TaxID=1881057 RepID=UPI00088D5942|nr:PilN domain-containing protein [Quadrisphaera sp. DSM 44207]SDQ46653.1 Fimbrial assembly protein (PilN) [Quadrisphaera sp. DSM 44207]